MKLAILLLVIISIMGNSSFAQANCPTQSLYRTKSLGDGKDSIRASFPLNFVITADSIIISFDPVGKNKFAAFRIISKECFWNEDFSEGRSEYKLMLYDIKGNKYPALNLIIDKKHPIYIELLHENAEKRIFM